MSSRRGDAKVEIERIAELFSPLLHKEIQFSFGKFEFPIIIQEIRLAKLTDMKNAPDKRKDGDISYTPPVMQFITSEGYLYFVVEDIEIAGITNGLRIITAANNIDFREV